MLEHIYQFCAMKGDQYFDGIIITTCKVSNHERYVELKKDIGEKMHAPYEKITIISFSYLGIK